MTNELIKLLSDFFQLIKDHTEGLIPNDQQLVDELKPLAEKLVAELGKQEPPEVKV